MWCTQNEGNYVKKCDGYKNRKKLMNCVEDDVVRKAGPAKITTDKDMAKVGII